MSNEHPEILHTLAKRNVRITLLVESSFDTEWQDHWTFVFKRHRNLVDISLFLKIIHAKTKLL